MRRLLLIAVIVAGCGGSLAPLAPIPTAIATEAPTPEVTPEPTPGVIEFGLDFDTDTLAIIKPTSRFKRTYPLIAYVAYLSGPANAVKLTEIFATLSMTGAEKVIYAEPFDLSDPSSDTIGNKADLATLAGHKAGTYVMRILRDATVLAEGTFTLVK